MLTRTSRGWPYVNNRSVPRRRYSVCSTYQGNYSVVRAMAGDFKSRHIGGAALEERDEDLSQIVSTPLVQ
ncbi:hypothetical protein DPMN_074954 [Dreissena polymorpha]|uniref:Uncharacterized protein n=1 Tax=Dreissena polymorpha TaxID=45954 RepID=A0A9D4BM65_DREPO|nr:hypothetical protein DPMN_074954 [Dreissena polymorpha]